MNGKTIGYWITTGLLALGTTGTGVVKLLNPPEMIQNFENLGYPTYLIRFLGLWYVLAVVALLAPKLGRVKEWAYAGLFFAFSGALFSHLANGDAIAETIPLMVFLALTVGSYVLRPADRTLDGRGVGVPADS